MKYAFVVLATLAALLLIGLIFPYTGIYNVSATEGHSGFEEWYLNTLSKRSIRARTDDIMVQGDLGDSIRVAKGAVGFSEMCQTCHSAPGHERSVTGKGLAPEPPNLSEEAAEWKPQEIYWILENGIKMAGMPAYGPTHTEEELWEIVAFVEQLPDMTPERYKLLTEPPEPAPADSANTVPRADDGHDHVH